MANNSHIKVKLIIVTCNRNNNKRKRMMKIIIKMKYYLKLTILDILDINKHIL